MWLHHHFRNKHLVEDSRIFEDWSARTQPNPGEPPTRADCLANDTHLLDDACVFTDQVCPQGHQSSLRSLTASEPTISRQLPVHRASRALRQAGVDFRSVGTPLLFLEVLPTQRRLAEWRRTENWAKAFEKIFKTHQRVFWKLSLEYKLTKFKVSFIYSGGK